METEVQEKEGLRPSQQPQRHLTQSPTWLLTGHTFHQGSWDSQNPTDYLCTRPQTLLLPCTQTRGFSVLALCLLRHTRIPLELRGPCFHVQSEESVLSSTSYVLNLVLGSFTQVIPASKEQGSWESKWPGGTAEWQGKWGTGQGAERLGGGGWGAGGGAADKAGPDWKVSKGARLASR